MTESLLVQTKRLLRQADLKARKGLGQHFLVDGGVLPKILAAAELAIDDTVVEVGPGLGVLTRELARRAGKVIAVELDDNLATLLKKSLTGFENVTIVNEDILKLDPATLVTDGKPYKVVANLPYYITAPVLRHFLEAKTKPRMMVVMVQKEVAKTITAEPGQRSLLTISVLFYGQPKIITCVPARAFYPAPEVDSAVLRIDTYKKPPIDADANDFFTLARAGFTNPRKQVINSLAQGLNIPKAEVLDLLVKSNIDPRRRSETFTLEEWGRLWKVWQKKKG
ncbi:MAG: 16S rRNA (adenine(1518)-N(6)/adenine(1519)-N(6))-dimethyltransferase RsmA [Dehalococcoidales bacterium]|nr:16S rRNA (adenine(1518)-N(6)/adenine(1519)-N(6))-dimethyltransferase RsmA [Dehalococcoidales bacterium]